MTQEQMIEKMKQKANEYFAEKMKAKVSAKPQKAQAPKRIIKISK